MPIVREQLHNRRRRDEKHRQHCGERRYRAQALHRPLYSTKPSREAACTAMRPSNADSTNAHPRHRNVLRRHCDRSRAKTGARLSSVATNQDAFHAKYGGIVPEIAGRRHVALLSAAVEDALDRAGTTFEGIDGIAVTAGPGLIGSLVVGVAAAKALAFALDKPLYGINHLHGHVFAPFLDRDEGRRIRSSPCSYRAATRNWSR